MVRSTPARTLMVTYLFILTLLTELILGGSLILTLTWPEFRIWPPPGRESWEYHFTWALTIITMVGIVVVGLLDWGSIGLPVYLQVPVGVALIILGLGLILWGVRTLSIHATLGLGGQLVVEGPYRITRNPQYTGDIAAILGYIVLSNSWLALITGLIGTLWFVLAPFTEEPWLRERYGQQYEAYKKRVPRFIGRPWK